MFVCICLNNLLRATIEHYGFQFVEQRIGQCGRQMGFNLKSRKGNDTMEIVIKVGHLDLIEECCDGTLFLIRNYFNMFIPEKSKTELRRN